MSDDGNDKQPEHPAIQAILDAIEANGGKVIVKNLNPVSEEDSKKKPNILTRADITADLVQFAESKRVAAETFEESFGEDQDLYLRRSTCVIQALLLGDDKAFGHALSSYKEAMSLWNQQQQDVPSARECIEFQVATSFNTPTFALEVGMFAGAVLGRGGFTSAEVLRLMAEPAFTHHVLTLDYRVADLCNLGRETLDRLDNVGATKN